MVVLVAGASVEPMELFCLQPANSAAAKAVVAGSAMSDFISSISILWWTLTPPEGGKKRSGGDPVHSRRGLSMTVRFVAGAGRTSAGCPDVSGLTRSEERRVGEEGRCRWW